MARDASSAAARTFGREPVAPDLLRLCRALRPPPRAVLDAERGTSLELGELSQELLIEAVVGDRADCIYAFCRLNAEALRREVARTVGERALPISIDAIVAEALAEVADAARFVAPTRVAELYASLPEVAATVIANVVDETLGFVPTCSDPEQDLTITKSMSERLAVPEELLAGLSPLIDRPTTRIVAAQALLQLSPHDRARLLAASTSSSETSSTSRSVASLLSGEAARRRLADEYDRIARWLRTALEPEGARVDEEEGVA